MSSKAFEIKRATHFYLENGMKIIAHHDESNPIVCLQLHIRSGSIHENDNQRGFAHFIEHLVFKSTKNFSYNEISDLIPKLGGVINAYTDLDSTCYYVILPSENLNIGLSVISDLVQSATFSKHDVKLEKDIIIEEIKQYESEPEIEFIEFIQTDYFVNNPMRFLVLGSKESIRGASYQDLRSFYDEHYTPSNAFLVVSGDYQPGSLLDSVQQRFSEWKPRELCRKYLNDFAEPEVQEHKSMFRFKKKTPSYLAFTLPELCDSHLSANPLLIGMRALAIGKSSVLYKRLVERDKLCSSIKVSSLSGTISGISVVLVTPNSQTNVNQIVRIILQEFTKILDEGIDVEALHLVKQDILHGWLYAFESMESIASTIATDELCGSYTDMYSYIDQIMNINNDDLKAHIRKYWNPKSLCFYYQDSSRAYEDFVKGEIPKLITIVPDQPLHVVSTHPSPVSSYQFESSSLKSDPIHESELENIYSYTTSSGQKVIYKHTPHKPICGIAFSSEISQLFETQEQRSHNYLCTTSLLYGSSYKSYEQILSLSRKLGFNLRVSHNIDTTTIKGKCFPNEIGTVLEVLSELLLFPTFDKRYLSLIKGNTIDSMHRDRHQPLSIAYKNWQKMLLGLNNNIESNSSTIKSISRTSRAQIFEWYQRWNLPSQSAICITGMIDPLDVFSLCEKYFGKPFDRYNSVPVSKPSPRYSPQKSLFKVRKENLEQTIVNIGGSGCPASDIRLNTAFHVLAQIIGGDINSRMFNTLREKHAYTYQTGFDFSSIHCIGMWNAYFLCKPTHYKEALAVFMDILADIRENGITNAELETAKKYMIGMHRLDLESASWQATTISNLIALGYNIEHYLTRETRINSVTMQEIQTLADLYLNPSKLYTYILT